MLIWFPYLWLPLCLSGFPPSSSTATASTMTPSAPPRCWTMACWPSATASRTTAPSTRSWRSPGAPGPGRLRQDGQIHAKPVWHRLLGFVPSRLKGFPLLASTVPPPPVLNIIVQFTLRKKFPFYYIFSVPLTHLDIHVLDLRIHRCYSPWNWTIKYYW